MLLQSAPLRALLLLTLQRSLHEAEPYSLPHLTMAALELAEPIDDSAGAAEAALGEEASSRRAGGGRGRGARRLSGAALTLSLTPNLTVTPTLTPNT